jgi:hypothetical protein
MFGIGNPIDHTFDLPTKPTGAYDVERSIHLPTKVVYGGVPPEYRAGK